MRLSEEIEYAYGQPSCNKRYSRACSSLQRKDKRHLQKKQVVTEKWLQLDINDLQQEIHDLVSIKQVLQSNRLSNHVAYQRTVMDITEAYYRLLKNGYTATVESNIPSFLHAVVHPNMKAGIHSGIQLMFTQWDYYTQLLNISGFRLHSMKILELEGNSVVKTWGEFRFVISRATIEGIFPHILGNECLVQKLLGLRLRCECTIDFYYNSKGKLIRYSEVADFIGALSPFIPDPAQLSALMQNALIHEESMLGDIQNWRVSEDTADKVCEYVDVEDVEEESCVCTTQTKASQRLDIQYLLCP